MSHETNALPQIHRQIMWNRLIAVVEEQAQIMIRTAFSTTVREAGGLSAGTFALQGGTPAVHRGKIVGLFANTAHVIDVGGLGMGPEGRSVFEEGMYIPITRCFEQGRANATFFDIIRAGTRLPVELEGDIYSLCACNDAGARRLVAMMDEFEMDSLQPLADFIFDSSHRATVAEIARLPRGAYRAEICSDGYEEPVTLKAEMTILDDSIEVDYAGTSGLSSRGINVPPAYCRAYSCFGIKVVVAPEIPNNWASLAPYRMKIPEGCILNAPRPYPVSVRHVIGHLLPDLMMGCLHQAVPERVTAEGASALWNPPMRGGGAISGQARGNKPVIDDFEIITFNSGGTGARPTQDGLNATAFPSGVRTMPVEATENVAPVVIWRKELKPNSGGAGRTRGGVGQIMEIATKGDLEFAVNASFDRIAHAPRGREGGLNGAPGRVARKNGTVLRTKGFQVIPDGDRLVLELPGGAGMGDPTARDPALVGRDVRDGLVSAENAHKLYKVSVTDDFAVDLAETARIRLPE